MLMLRICTFFYTDANVLQTKALWCKQVLQWCCYVVATDGINQRSACHVETGCTKDADIFKCLLTELRKLWPYIKACVGQS